MSERSDVDRDARVRWDAGVPKYDAFGREIGEDTLTGLGGTPRHTQEPDGLPEGPAATAPREARAAPRDISCGAPPPEPATRGPLPAAPRRGTRRVRGNAWGCLFALVFLAVILAGPVIALVSLVDGARDVFDEVTGQIDELEPDELGVTPPPDRAPAPTGITTGSMIAPENLEPVLRFLRDDGTRRITRLTLRPELVATDQLRGGRARSFEMTYDARVTRGEWERPNPTFGTVALADIDPRTPARLVRNAAKRFPVDTAQITHIIGGENVFTGRGQRWIAYFANGIYVEGDARGRVIRKISG
jgi:hypothetical protein